MAIMKGSDVVVMMLTGLFTFNSSVFQTFCGFGGVLLLHIQWQLFVMYGINTSVEIPDPNHPSSNITVEASIFHLTVLGPEDVHSVVYISYICNIFTQGLLAALFIYQDYLYSKRQQAKWDALLPDDANPPDINRNASTSKNYYKNYRAFNWKLTLMMTLPLTLGCLIGLFTINYISEAALTYILFSSCIFFVLTFISLWMMQSLEKRRIEDVIKEDLLTLENLARVQMFNTYLGLVGSNPNANRSADNISTATDRRTVQSYVKREKIARFLEHNDLLDSTSHRRGHRGSMVDDGSTPATSPAATPAARSPGTFRYTHLEEERQRYLDKYNLSVYMNEGNTSNRDNVNKGPFMTVCIVSSFFAGLSASYIGTSAPPILIFAIWSRIPPFLFKINYGVSCVIPCLARFFFVLGGGVFENTDHYKTGDSLVNVVYNHATKNSKSEVLELFLFGLVAVLCSILGIALSTYILYYHNRIKAKKAAAEGVTTTAVRSVRNYYFSQNNKKSFYFSVVITLLALALVLFVKKAELVTVVLIIGYTLVGYSFYAQNVKHKRRWNDKETYEGRKKSWNTMHRHSRHKYPPHPQHPSQSQRGSPGMAEPSGSIGL